MTTPPSASDPADAPDHWEALARYVAGESEPDEAERIRVWLGEDPSRQALIDALDRSFQSLAFQPPPDLDVDAALQRVTQRMAEPAIVPIGAGPRERRPLRWRTTVVRAAAAVALVLGGALLYRALQDGAPAQADAARSYATAVGQVDSVRLSDGTLVVLAPGSELVVPAGYGVNERSVALTGEAMFDVIHDTDRPFTVRTGAAVIVDLGTTFTVRGRTAGHEVRVVVTSGAVLLRAEQADSGVVLQAGDRGVLDSDGRIVAERDVATDQDVAWTRGALVFQDAPIADVTADLRRWYGIELRVEDPALAGRHVTATFQGEDAQQVLHVLELALGARIEQRGDTAVVRLR